LNRTLANIVSEGVVLKKSMLVLFIVVSMLSARITVAKLDGTVDNGMAYLLNRSLENRTVQDTVIFQVNTYGGLLMTAFDMADSIFRSKAYTIAFVEQKAISAGALISIACDEIVMGEGSTIGDCAPVMQGEEGPQILNEKIQSPLRAKFRLFADKNGYPRYLAAAMVSPDLKIYKITTKDSVYYTDLIQDKPKIVGASDTVIMVDKGELLTLTENEAKATGFASAIYPDFNSYKTKLNVPSSAELYERNWSERFVALIGSIAPILMMIGMAGIYIESRTPGIGVPGVIGVVCLLLAYAGQQMAGLAGYVEFLLLAVGILLLAIEVFVVPGFGVVGIAGIVVIAISSLLALQNFTIPSPELPFQEDILRINIETMGFALFGAFAITVLFFWLIFPRLKYVVDGPILSESLESEPEDCSLLEKIATVSKDLHPSGKVMVDGVEIDAQSEGFLILKGETVKIVGKRHGAVIVEKMEV